MTFKRICCIVAVVLATVLPAISATVTADFTSATTVPVTSADYTATGNVVSLSLGFAPPTGTNLTVVKNTGLVFISGRFSNLAHGQAVDLTYDGKSYRFMANYYGGTGNDLVLHWAYQDLTSFGSNYIGQLGNNSTTDSSVPVFVTQSGILAGRTVVSMAVGDSWSLALCSDNTMVSWGRNNAGQLGNNSTTTSSVPVAVTQSGVLIGKAVVSIAAGGGHNIALCSDGTLVAWGGNSSGQLGNNSTTNSSVPVSVTRSSALTGKTVVAVAAGGSHSIALCSDGTLVAWGGNTYGQLGNNSTTSTSVPVSVTRSGVLAGKTVVSIAAGWGHSLVLCSDGTVVAWGYNSHGQLGNSSTTNSSVPVLVTKNSVMLFKTVVLIAAGSSHSIALCSDGTLVAWGGNTYGQLGNNSTTNSSVPVPVTQSGVLTGKTVVSMTVGYNHNLVLCSDGSLFAWGSNYNGQLGNNSTTNSSVPVLVARSGVLSGKNVAAVAAGGNHSLVLTNVQSLRDLSGLSISSGTLNPEFFPGTTVYNTSVTTTAITISPTVAASTATIKVNGTSVTSGTASAPLPLELGSNIITTVVTAWDGTTTTYTITVTRMPLEADFTSQNSIPDISEFYAATGASVVINLGFAPPPGTNLTIVKNTGLAFISGQFSNLAHGQAMDLTYGGKLYRFVANYYGGTGNDLVLQWAYQDLAAWGYGAYGQLGNNSTTGSHVPVSVTQSGILAGKTVVSMATGGSHSIALCSDGTMAAWGYNAAGQLGNNSTTNSSVPVLVTRSSALTGKTVVSVAAGNSHSIALCSDGTLVAWGENTYGQLGNNSTTNSSVPVLVTQSGALGGKAVVSMAAGGYHSIGLCSDGTLATWGYNLAGQLGNNSTTNSSVPVLVIQSGALLNKTIAAISAGFLHNLALCSDGTMAAWGESAYGSLGDSYASLGKVPVLVIMDGALNGKSVVEIETGIRSSLVLCSDGTLVAWGDNTSGQLGNNSSSSYSGVPVFVTQNGVLAGKTVVSISAGNSHNLALCSDGTLAAWGDDTYSQLGGYIGFASSVPVLVTQSGFLAGKTVTSVTGGSSYSLAMASVSNSRDLSGLSLSAGNLSPLFDPGARSYCASVLFTTTSITLKPTAADSSATIYINDSPVISGSTSQSIPLNVGTNIINVVVTAQDGVNATAYMVEVTRMPSSVTALASLELSSGGLNPAFASSTFSYATTVSNTTTALSLKPTVVDAFSTIQVNGQAVNSGENSGSSPLTVGLNTLTVVVTAQDGVSTTAYTVEVTRMPSSVSALASLELSSGGLNPVFASSTVSYTSTVSNTTAALSLKPTLVDAFATIEVNGQAINSGENSVSSPLTVGLNTFIVIVTAQDGFSTTAYAVEVTRLSSPISRLSSLEVSSGGLNPTFSSSTTSYVATVSNTTMALSLKPTAADASVAIQVNGKTVNSGEISASLPLAIGLNTLTVVVITQDGLSTTAYTIEVTRMPSSVATLASLELSIGGLNPTFESSTTSYATTVSNTFTAFSLKPTVADAFATIQVNEQAVNSGDSSASSPLTVGLNTFTVVVTAQDGVTTTAYTIEVTRAESSDATLVELTLKSATLSPVFRSSTLNYTANVSNFTSSIQINPKANNAAANIEVNGVVVASGALSKALPLTIGKNAIKVLVTAQDGTSKIYTINVTRAESSDATLAELKVNGAALSRAFKSSTLKYSAKVPESTTSVKIVPKASNSIASIKVNGKKVVSGKKTKRLPLKKGNNVIKIQVTAQDGTVKIYKITITRLKKSTKSKSSSNASVWKATSGELNIAATTKSKVVVDGKAYRQIAVEHPDAASHYIIGVSSDLVNWFSGDKHTTTVVDSRRLLLVRDNIPVTPETKRFIRVVHH
jgi:alpha-tubulin suppressor-like RCC1 family protein